MEAKRVFDSGCKGGLSASADLNVKDPARSWVIDNRVTKPNTPMKEIVHYVGLDVYKETVAGAVASQGGCEGNRYTRCARPAEPESVG